MIIQLTNKEKKGISSVLNWLEVLLQDDEALLVELPDSVEDVIQSRKTDKWRSIDL